MDVIRLDLDQVVPFDLGIGFDYRFFVGFCVAVKVRLHLRIDQIGDFPFVVLDHIDELLIVQVAVQLRYCLSNKLLEKLMLSEKATLNLLSVFKKLRLIDAVGRDILFKEAIRKGPFIYEDYTGVSQKAAEEFLKKIKIKEESYYVSVFTPEGIFCKDIMGYYQ